MLCPAGLSYDYAGVKDYRPRPIGVSSIFRPSADGLSATQRPPPASYPRIYLGRPRLVVASAPLCVHWIDGHRLDLDEKVLAGGARAVDLDIDKRPRVFNRKRLQIGDGAHDSLLALRS